MPTRVVLLLSALGPKVQATTVETAAFVEGALPHGQLPRGDVMGLRVAARRVVQCRIPRRRLRGREQHLRRRKDVVRG